MSFFKIPRFIPVGDPDKIVESTAATGPGLNRTAEEISSRAANNAHRRTGKVADSFRVVPAAKVDGREIAYVVNDDFVSVFREFGTVNNAPERALTRAAMEVGNFTDGA